MLTLRPYQIKAQDATIDFVHKQNGNGIISAECSAGKSLLIANTAEHLLSCKQRVVVLADRAKLIKQNHDKFAAPENVGIVSAGLGESDYRAPIVIGGIQTIYNKAARLGNVDWFLIDECEAVGNNFASDSRYHQLLRCYPSARLLGYTATPYTLSEGGISWGRIIHEITYQQLLDAGYCTPLTNKIGAEPDLSGVEHSGREFNLQSLGNYMRQSELVLDSANKTALYIRRAARKKTLGFCVDVEHAYAMAMALQQYGLVVDVVHGGMDEPTKAIHYDWFENGDTEILLNVELLTKGADFPCIDCIVNYRPTESMRLWFQMIGRGIRLYTGKSECLLLDFTGNLKKFGTLGNPLYKYFGAEKKKIGKAQKVCPACEESINIGLTQCPACDYVFLKAEVEKELKHEAEADIRSDMTKPHSAERYYTVGHIEYSHHRSAKGNDSFRVQYHAGRFSCSQFIPFGRTEFWAQKRCREFMKGRSDMLPETIEEALVLCKGWRVPKIIKVVPQKGNEKYWEVKEICEWQENTQNQQSSVNT